MMNLDLIPESARAAGLGALMKGAGMVTRFLPIPQPTLLVGPGASARLGQAVAGFGHDKVLIVTDPMIVKLGLLQPLTAALQAGGTPYAVFDEITPDAPIPLIERGIVIVAASGLPDSSAKSGYPGRYPGVYAVAAVDARRRSESRCDERAVGGLLRRSHGVGSIAGRDERVRVERRERTPRTGGRLDLVPAARSDSRHRVRAVRSEQSPGTDRLDRRLDRRDRDRAGSSPSRSDGR